MSMERRMDGQDIVWMDDGKEIVRIHETVEANEGVFYLTGSLNERSEIDFRQELMAFASVGLDVTVDLSATKRMTNGSLGALLDAVQITETMNRSFRLRNPSPEIRMQLDRAHVSRAFEIIEGGNKS